MNNTDKYAGLVTSEHVERPNFMAMVRASLAPLSDTQDAMRSLVDRFDLDQARGDQLDSIGLWVGMFRSVAVPITGIYFAWDTPQPASSPTLSSVAGGALAGATYYARITLVSSIGEGLASPEANLAVAANNLLRVTSPAAMPGVTGYNVYVSTATGTETKQNGGTPVPIGTNWTEPTTGLVTGAGMPATSAGQNIGWGSGYWQGPFDPSAGIEYLDDDTFRTLIRAKIAANLWDGTLETMQSFWDYVFGPGVVSVQDNQDMTITLVYDTLALNTVTKSLLTQGRFPLKPAGVRINYTASTGAPIFSFNVSSPKFDGWTGSSVWASTGAAPAPAPAPPPPTITVADWAGTTLQSSDYWMNADIWNAVGLTRGTYTDDSGSGYYQQIGFAAPRTVPGSGAVDGRITWGFPLGTTEVKSYPSIIAGNKPGWYNTGPKPGGVDDLLLPSGLVSTVAPCGPTPNTIFPLALPIASLKSSFSYAHNQTPTGAGHLAYDIWLQNSGPQTNGFTVPPISCEIMVPLNFWGHYGEYGYRNPGWYSHDDTIDGKLWHIYFAPSFNGAWVFIVFEPPGPVAPGTIDLGALINYARTQGWLDASQNPMGLQSTHCVSVELGIEPYHGTGDINITNFSVHT